ncbi:MAG: hypothetical protein RBT68_10605 [Spirochaetia bacterium]|nr:hypothetical protein [Spirochaetia bacterium]
MKAFNLIGDFGGKIAVTGIFLMIVVFLLCALASCAVNPPGFVATSHRLIVLATDGTEKREERLSFFASIGDQDGAADIEYLYVIHDESELAWPLTADNWVRRDEGNSVWLGSNGLQPGDNNLMPRGRYRAVVVDKAGERDELNFNLNAPVTKDYALPVIRLAGSQLTLDSPYQMNTLFFLDPADNPVKTVGLNPGTNSLDALWGDSSWRTAAYTIRAYGFDPKAETGFFSWNIKLNG